MSCSHRGAVCGITMEGKHVVSAEPSIEGRVRRSLAYRNIYSRSAYARHQIKHGHSLGQMEDIMDVTLTVVRTKENNTKDTAEKCHIYRKNGKKHRN